MIKLEEAWMQNSEKVIKDNKGIATYILDVSNTLKRIAEQYEQKDRQLDKAYEKIKNFKAEVYKDEELQSMKQTYEEMKKDYYRGFPISKENTEKIKNWIINHENQHHGGYPCYHGASGGGYEYSFYPTAIGTAGQIACSSCKRKAIRICDNNPDRLGTLLKESDTIFTFQEIE